MVVGEFIAFIALLFGGGVGVKVIWAWIQSSKLDREELEAIQKDLRAALKSRDHRQLDDFMVIWAGKLNSEVLKHVKARRDELYIEEDKVIK